jgi:hypothetical protein
MIDKYIRLDSWCKMKYESRHDHANDCLVIAAQFGFAQDIGIDIIVELNVFLKP